MFFFNNLLSDLILTSETLLAVIEKTNPTRSEDDATDKLSMFMRLKAK